MLHKLILEYQEANPGKCSLSAENGDGYAYVQAVPSALGEIINKHALWLAATRETWK
jgi:hypothetical protein